MFKSINLQDVHKDLSWHQKDGLFARDIAFTYNNGVWRARGMLSVSPNHFEAFVSQDDGEWQSVQKGKQQKPVLAALIRRLKEICGEVPEAD